MILILISNVNEIALALTKPLMTSTTMIKMLKYFDACKGNGMGNGVKGRFNDTMTMAVRHHQQYCNNNSLDGNLI
jgi:hypothetical protein